MSEKTKATRNRKKSPLYECIRCNYTTENKTDMRRHLYSKNKPCSGTKNNNNGYSRKRKHCSIK